MHALLWRSDMRTQRDEMYSPDRFSFFLFFVVGFWDGSMDDMKQAQR